MDAVAPDDLRLSIDIQRLHLLERRFLGQLALAQAGDNPYIEQARDLPQRYYQDFLLLATRQVEFILTEPQRLLLRLQLDQNRAELYGRLLRGGAPRDMLQRCFAKSRRVIEVDRARAGISSKGRPPALDGETAYRILGAWDSIGGEVTDYAERMAIMMDSFPRQSLTSIYRLLQLHRR